MRMLYKYPQAAFPYDALVEENARRSQDRAANSRLLDTGVFDENRYFDVVIGIRQGRARRHPDARHRHNRGPDAAPLHLLPQSGSRNTWSWSDRAAPTRLLRSMAARCWHDHPADAATCGSRSTTGADVAVLRERDQRAPAVRHATDAGPFKDGINDYVVHGKQRRGQSDAARAPSARRICNGTLAPGDSRARCACGCARSSATRPASR